jgi:hypothetical protein
LVEFDTVAHAMNQFLCNICYYCASNFCVCSLNQSAMGLP